MKTYKIAKIAALLSAIWLPILMACGSDEADEWASFDDAIETESEKDANIEILYTLDFFQNFHGFKMPSILDYVTEKSENIACVHSNDEFDAYNQELIDTLSAFKERDLAKLIDDDEISFVQEEYMETFKCLIIPKINPETETLIIAKFTGANRCLTYGFEPVPREYVVGDHNGKTYIRMTNACDNFDLSLQYVKEFKPVDHLLGFIVNRPNLKPSDLMIDMTTMSDRCYELGKDRNLITATSRKYEHIAFPGWELTATTK